MADVQAIQEAIIAVYETLVLPNGIGTPTGYKLEPKGSWDSADLPFAWVGRSVTSSIRSLSSDRKMITRTFITDLGCYLIDDQDEVNETRRNNTSDCLDTVYAAFLPARLTVDGVFSHEVTADTSDTELYARYINDKYIGVRFRHEVTYLQLS